jgi:transcriptional regulator with XRE-family HTH domain
MKGSKLRSWRVRQEKTQTALAELLGVSQKRISTWETSNDPLPAWVEARIKEAIHGGRGEVSTTHSWPPFVFKELRRHTVKQANEVFVRAIITPSETEPNKFADFVGEVRFSGLTLRGQILYHDHIRDSGVEEGTETPNLVLGGSKAMPESMEGEEEVAIRQGDGALLVKARDKNDEHVIQTSELGTVSARLDEDLTVRNPQYLAYEIKKADADTPVKVFLRSIRGFSLMSRDSIGYAYYAEGDFLVEQVRLEVEFKEGLTPEPDPPISRAQLIRRTSVRPDSTDRNLPEPTRVHNEQTGSTVYKFGPLLRPKSGFLYSLVWRKLKR